MAKKSWLVKSQKVKLPLDLPDCDEWIEVRTEISAGQSRRIKHAGVSSVKGRQGQPEVELPIDWGEAELVRILEWVTDWSFVDADEKPLEFNRENLDELDDEAYEAIVAALDEHVEAKQKEKKAKRPKKSGKGRLKRISSGNEKTGS